ncbi:unnamed protein product [Somion occarium]|uniref:Uncharacterized protein n=1 Tax=Somion occarium TaxID=3059160 RepID=A0ABP1DU68_9APHY
MSLTIAAIASISLIAYACLVPAPVLVYDREKSRGIRESEQTYPDELDDIERLRYPAITRTMAGSIPLAAQLAWK